jgi:hypothetical protein
MTDNNSNNLPQPKATLPGPGRAPVRRMGNGAK